MAAMMSMQAKASPCAFKATKRPARVLEALRSKPHASQHADRDAKNQPAAWASIPMALVSSAILLNALPAFAASANGEGFDLNKNFLENFVDDTKATTERLQDVPSNVMTDVRKSFQRGTAKQSVPPPDPQQSDRLQLETNNKAVQKGGEAAIDQAIGRAFDDIFNTGNKQ